LEAERATIVVWTGANQLQQLLRRLLQHPHQKKIVLIRVEGIFGVMKQTNVFHLVIMINVRVLNVQPNPQVLVIRGACRQAHVLHLVMIVVT